MFLENEIIDSKWLEDEKISRNTKTRIGLILQNMLAKYILLL